MKPILKKVWCFDGRRPLAPVQHRYEWRYLVGFVHPASGRTIFHLATTVSIPLFEAELTTFAERCVALQARPELICSTTLFHWWPKRIKNRHGPRLN